MTVVDANPLTSRMEGPSPAVAVARDLAKRGVMIAPISIMLGAAFWGTDGALSVALGLGIVVVETLPTGSTWSTSTITTASPSGVAWTSTASRRSCASWCRCAARRTWASPTTGTVLASCAVTESAAATAYR